MSTIDNHLMNNLNQYERFVFDFCVESEQINGHLLEKAENCRLSDPERAEELFCSYFVEPLFNELISGDCIDHKYDRLYATFINHSLIQLRKDVLAHALWIYLYPYDADPIHLP